MYLSHFDKGKIQKPKPGAFCESSCKSIPLFQVLYEYCVFIMAKKEIKKISLSMV
jgi:hypothetical protein